MHDRARFRRIEVNENIDQAQLAADDKRQTAENERYRKDQGIDDRPGTNPKDQPGTGEPRRGRGLTFAREIRKEPGPIGPGSLHGGEATVV